jgi:hypothetical protein
MPVRNKPLIDGGCRAVFDPPMTRAGPSSERRKLALPLNGKSGAMIVGAIALVVLQPQAERLWVRLQAPSLEKRMGGPGFPLTFDQAKLRIEQARAPAPASSWGDSEEEGVDCSAIDLGAFWRICGRAGRPETINASVYARTRQETGREILVLVDAAARGATPAQRQAVVQLISGQRAGTVLIGKVRISALPLPRGGWFIDARPAADRAQPEIPSAQFK